jgi:ribosome-binding protein aMBF1 (putative translation factor)
VIANERQYAVTHTQLRRFEKAAAEQQRHGPPEDVDPRIGKAMVDGLLGQAETLRAELKRYEDLRDGRVRTRELETLRDFPTALIEARIAAGLTQKALGKRLGVKEQQIQRWEANLYSGVGVERLQEVADALGMGVKETVSYPVSSFPA